MCFSPTSLSRADKAVTSSIVRSRRVLGGGAHAPGLIAIISAFLPTHPPNRRSWDRLVCLLCALAARAKGRARKEEDANAQQCVYTRPLRFSTSFQRSPKEINARFTGGRRKSPLRTFPKPCKGVRHSPSQAGARGRATAR